MEQEEIIKVNIEQLKSYNHDSYADDYLVVSNSLDHLLLGQEKVKLDLFLMLFCTEGHIQIELNNQSYSLEKNDLLLSPPNLIISKVLASPNHATEFVCLHLFWNELYNSIKTTGRSCTIFIRIRSDISVRMKSNHSINIGY